MTSTTAGAKSGSGWIKKWNPEDKEFWENGGKRVARRNLVFSIFAEFLGFSVWQLFSIVAALLPAIGFAFSAPQLFSLVALPGLVGATMRFPYTFAVGIFGGRNWTIISALLLLIPTVMLGIIIQNPDTPYWQFALAAALGGFGGGNFSSSMANISYFFPNEQKGTALGINAAGGNLGVGIVQLLVPFVITVGAVGAVLGGGSQTRTAPDGTATTVFIQNAAFFWVPLVLLSAVCAYFFMNNLNVSQASPREQVPVAKRKHTWVMSYLYIGTFGSFIGYSASFPVLITSQFPGYSSIYLAALGPIVGSLARPIGGWLSDKTGGARVTFWNFLVMALGVVSALYFLAEQSLVGFFLSFMVLFLTAGIGNGSTYRMIPTIFRTQRVREARGEGAVAEAARQGQRESSFVLGFAGAIAAYGGFVIPQAYKYSIGATGGPQTALVSFVVFYATCMAVTWYFYYRRNAEIPC
ncbi:MAG: Nitrate/nitrite transporter [uncultured Rubrobacteraceae bacterium]|uniref:Nitrate/nitrite transporter n=1 Tax=uncultured Rubrobacteraceae bacterium TaxID=349277 RepID=A0A6J4R0B1_9ACTN|nr:MAG: Nitrate/nitrite transporter [uncultured Rubrobacteraceae bacterium]